MCSDYYMKKMIHSIKKLLNDDGEVLRLAPKGEIISSKIQFNDPLDIAEFKNYNSLILPKDYIEFLKVSDGAKLYLDNYHGSQPLLTLYSLKEILKEKAFYENSLHEENRYPIGTLLDRSDLLVDQAELNKGNPYLLLADGTKAFDYGFQEWLDKFFIAQGNEFWLLDNPYL
ncbi:SMI1/KNR4 family protein [Heyndrickxia acidiproducens]|uniref:SMI1/KNR4 family protein n=1 Tax=Heyndrickxia acidiproducens TaxID=1121084 RepID=UPI00035E42DC|nr:SMI1/KNR4 family protein [Heyndrickxia acidiproducens]